MTNKDAVCVCGHAIEDHVVEGTESTKYSQGECLKPGCTCKRFKSLKEATNEQLEREALIRRCMDEYGLSRAAAEEWADNEDATNL